MTDAATNAGTHGHEVRPGAEQREPVDDVLDVIVESEAPVFEADVSCVVPVGDVHVVLGEQRAHRPAQQRGEMARERGDEQHLGLGEAVVLAEVHQRAEGPDVEGFLLHGHRPPAAVHGADAERRTLMREVGPLDELAAGGEVPGHE
jgi:hypothetical protein